ncbi:DnaJ domain-containing protein [Legionella impletisoli]|uniref:J domain-containing protein n=1 Tax=Legionella impletisoli TaxID=343510 RepID=A0A917JSS0_9GAMM|nr:DnaJ domain-containing protein [Legionella impletisoli]GGI84656.1 hypothetical protein GCM10007966_11540 [Legionella impletisoli]
MPNEENYFVTLGLGERDIKDITFQDVKKARNKLVLQHHPDKGGDEETFKKIYNAFDAINNEDKFQQYKNNLLQKAATATFTEEIASEKSSASTNPTSTSPQPTTSPQSDEFQVAIPSVEPSAEASEEEETALEVGAVAPQVNAQPPSPEPLASTPTTPQEAEESDQKQEKNDEQSNETQNTAGSDVNPQMADNPLLSGGNPTTMLEFYIEMMKEILNRDLGTNSNANDSQAKEQVAQNPAENGKAPEATEDSDSEEIQFTEAVSATDNAQLSEAKQNSQQSIQASEPRAQISAQSTANVLAIEDTPEAASPQTSLAQMSQPSSSPNPSAALLAIADNTLSDRQTVQASQQKQLELENQQSTGLQLPGA